MKQIKTTEELLAHMEEKGIKFNYVSKEEAEIFLGRNNYYFKLSSYRHNFEKYKNGKQAGKYLNLDFGHLKELSTLDRHLRYYLLQMCMDIEHYIKVRLMAAITKDENEDGYTIVQQFLRKEDENFKILKSIWRHKSGPYCKGLIEKYYPYFPVWVFIEVISFSDLIHFCSFYETYSGQSILSDIDNKFLNTVRDIRNACAHSNCLLNTISLSLPESHQADIRIRQFVDANSNNPEISTHGKQKYLNNELSYNLITIIYVYSLLVPEPAKTKMFKDLSEFVHGRMRKHGDYKFPDTITSPYKFWVKLIDNLYVNL